MQQHPASLRWTWIPRSPECQVELTPSVVKFIYHLTGSGFAVIAIFTRPIQDVVSTFLLLGAVLFFARLTQKKSSFGYIDDILNLAWKKSYFCVHQSLIFGRKHGSRVWKSCFSDLHVADALVLWVVLPESGSGTVGCEQLCQWMCGAVVTLWRSDYSLKVCQTCKTGLVLPSPLFLANIFVVRGGKIRWVFLGNIPGLSFWASTIIFSLVNCSAFSLLLHRQLYLWRLQLSVWSGCKSKA